VSPMQGGKKHFWCTRHEKPQWSLHNPDSFPNLCKFHPKYAELEAAWTKKGGSGSTVSGLTSTTGSAATAEDITLDSVISQSTWIWKERRTSERGARLLSGSG
jgi:hypothetical protein